MDGAMSAAMLTDIAKLAILDIFFFPIDFIAGVCRRSGFLGS
jgi:hypothetical protein